MFSFTESFLAIANARVRDARITAESSFERLMSGDATESAFVGVVLGKTHPFSDFACMPYARWNGTVPEPPKPGRAPTASACEPYRELIEDALGRGRNAVAIWQDLVTDHGFTARYASVRRFVLKLRGSAPTERGW